MSTPSPKLNGNIIADMSIRHPVLVVMLMLLAIVVGLLAYRSLPVNYLPDLSIATTTVTVTYPGASPQTVNDQIAETIEEAVASISGVDTITAVSNEGRAQVIIAFVDGVDPDQALQEVRDKVDAIAPQFPEDADDPVYAKFDIADAPILQLSVIGDATVSPLQLRTLIDDTIVPELQKANGIGSIDVSGGQERQINVYLRLDRLQALQITPGQVSRAIDSANTNLGLGNITTGDESINLRAPSQIVQASDIAGIRIQGTRYRVGDIATVEDGIAEAESYARLNGQDAISLAIRKQSGTNTTTVASAVLQEIERLFAAQPNLQYVVTDNQADAVQGAVDASIEEMLIAILAAVLIVWLFIRDLGNTLIMVAGIPIILIATFAIMWAFGISLNIISLMALALAVGLVIDDAIVVRENIFRHMERGEPPLIAASRGTAQVSASVLAMTLTVVAVFLPVALTSGITGVIFKAFGITIAAAMTLSLIEAFTFAPMLSATAFHEKHYKKPQHTNGSADQSTPPPELSAEEELLHEANEDPGKLGRSYERVLDWTLRHRWAAVLGTMLILALSVWAATGLKFAFAPAQGSETLGVGFQLPPGASLQATDQLTRRAEEIIRADPDVVAVQTSVGGADGDERASFTVLTKSTYASDGVRERLRPQLSFLPELVFNTPSIDGGASTNVTNRNVQVQIQSSRPLEELVPVSEEVRRLALETPNLTDVGSSYSSGRPEIQFRLDPTKSGDLGLTNQEIGASVRALVNGDTATSWQQGGDDVDVVVRLPPGRRADINTIRAIYVPTGAGNVPLNSIAAVEETEGPTALRRYDRQNEIVIGANVAPGANQNDVQAVLAAKVAQLDLPNDVRVSFGGETENQSDAFSQLLIAMAMSILLVYMVLAAQFNSYMQPLVIMLAMPFSLLGAFIGLRLTGLPLDMVGMMGLIALMGLVVKNSILLVDFTNRLRQMGMDKETALERAGAIRLRPILMTSGSIIAGAIPIAAGIHIFSSGEGAEFRRTLGTVLIGGMISSTLLTLLVVPTAYSLLDSFLAFIRRLFRRRPRVHPQPALATAGATNGSNHTGNTTHLTNSHMQETDAHAPAARQADELTPDS